ncbi:MAG: elongation factor P [Candidatus Paceibacterota bacterium]|jgi:elongation factor P|nr:elongation factor P [Candidatus Paceibacterota bacterium]
MFSYSDLKKGVQFILEGEPYEVLESSQMKKAQRRPVLQAKVRSLITGNVFEKTFHQGETFEEAELDKFDAKFLYSHRGKFFFCEEKDPSKRFELSEEQIGPQAKFLKQNQVVQTVKFEGEIINVSLPIKVQLKVAEAPPGVKGDRAQGGTKSALLETGAQIQVPLFVEQGDTIEINTETGEYVKRI